MSMPSGCCCTLNCTGANIACNSATLLGLLLAMINNSGVDAGTAAAERLPIVDRGQPMEC